MPKVVFGRQFKFSPNGYTIVTYEPSDEAVDVSDRCAEVAIQAGAVEALEGTGGPQGEPSAADGQVEAMEEGPAAEETQEAPAVETLGELEAASEVVTPDPAPVVAEVVLEVTASSRPKPPEATAPRKRRASK